MQQATATRDHHTPDEFLAAAERMDALTLAPDQGEAAGGLVMIFQLGGAVLAAGPADEADRRARDVLWRYGELGAARRIPASDKSLDLRAVTIRSWGEDAWQPGAIYVATCTETMAALINRGRELIVPVSVTPGEPVIVEDAPMRLTLTAAVEELDPPGAAADAQPARGGAPAGSPEAASAVRPFTVKDVLGLASLGRAEVSEDVAEQALRAGADHFLRQLASLIARPSLENCDPNWIAKAARSMHRAGDAIQLAQQFSATPAPSLRRQMEQHGA